MGIILLIGVLAVIYIAYNDNQRKSSEKIPISEESSSLEIAKNRYANGDISHDEYERLKTDLGYFYDHIAKARRNTMKYYLSTKVHGDFEATVERVKSELKKEEFGILSDIDVKSTLQTKLGVDFRKYRILGACNPPFSYKALQAEDKIGTLLPCNVILQELEPDSIEVAAVDPKASMQGVSNVEIETIAVEIKDRLQKVIDSLTNN